MDKPKSKLERTREARWDEITTEYRRKHRRWVMDSLPVMSEADWKLYETWVAGFGALRPNTASRNSRKLRRQLKNARKGAWEVIDITTVTTTVTTGPKTLAARAAGGANKGRATRRK